MPPAFRRTRIMHLQHRSKGGRAHGVGCWVAASGAHHAGRIPFAELRLRPAAGHLTAISCFGARDFPSTPRTSSTTASRIGDRCASPIARRTGPRESACRPRLAPPSHFAAAQPRVLHRIVGVADSRHEMAAASSEDVRKYSAGAATLWDGDCETAARNQRHYAARLSYRW